MKKTQKELDRFRKAVFSAPVEDIHNTHNGEVPGHVRYGEDPVPADNNLGIDERAQSEYDTAYLQTKLEGYIQKINGPEELEDVTLLQWKRGANRIYDRDGDGVEDNVHKTHDELDEYFIPAVFGDVEDIYNTHHGNYPGHVQREHDIIESAPITNW